MTDGNTLADQERAALIEKEKQRISLERYKMKIIGEGWTIIPFLSLFYLLYALYEYYRYGLYDTLLIVVMGLLFGVCMFAHLFKEEWEKELSIKYEVHGYPDREILVRRFFEGKDDGKIIYEEGYIYTNFPAVFYLYQIAKAICYVATVSGVVIIGLFIFSGIEKAINDASLKDIGVFIVILLAVNIFNTVIIFNQRK